MVAAVREDESGPFAELFLPGEERGLEGVEGGNGVILGKAEGPGG